MMRAYCVRSSTARSLSTRRSMRWHMWNRDARRARSLSPCRSQAHDRRLHEMTSRPPETSPQTYARIGGGLYPFIIVDALFWEGFFLGSLLVPPRPAPTGNTILRSHT